MYSPAPPRKDDDVSLPPIVSPRVYINERMKALRAQMDSNTAVATHCASPPTSRRLRSPEGAQWADTAASSKRRLEELATAATSRQATVASHFFSHHREEHERVLLSAKATQEKMERAERNKTFQRIAQPMVRSWTVFVLLHLSLKAVQRSVFIGYKGKWKKIVVYLIAQRWLKMLRKRQYRCSTLRFNMILRRCIPQVVERIRARRRGGQTPIVRGFLGQCASATRFPRVLHQFLDSVRRAQRIVRRRIFGRKLRVSAIKIALDVAARSSREEKYSGVAVPEEFRWVVARRLVHLDMEAKMYERKNLLDRFSSDVESVDRNETAKQEVFVHGQSIVLQSAMITAFRMPSLIRNTGLLQFVKEYDHGKPISLEQRERLRRWYLQLYITVRSSLASNALLSPRAECKDTAANAVQPPRGATLSMVNYLLCPEGQAAAIAQVLSHQAQQRKRSILMEQQSYHLPSGTLATSKAGGTLRVMAKACPPVLLPFLHDNDLVMSVLGALSIPTMMKNKQLLKVQNITLLLRMTRDAWSVASRKVKNQLDVSTLLSDRSPQQTPLTPPQRSPLRTTTGNVGPLSMEEKLEQDKYMIDALSNTYSVGSSATLSEIQDVIRNVDFGFLDSFYRRAR